MAHRYSEIPPAVSRHPDFRNRATRSKTSFTPSAKINNRAMVDQGFGPCNTGRNKNNLYNLMHIIMQLMHIAAKKALLN